MVHFNYLQGGAAIVLSNGLIRRHGRDIINCIDSLRSHDYDLELGSCITRFANIPCTEIGKDNHIILTHDDVQELVSKQGEE